MWGRFDPVKNLPALLRVFAALRGGERKMEAALVGTGRLWTARRGIAAARHFAPHCSPDALSGCDGRAGEMVQVFFRTLFTIGGGGFWPDTGRSDGGGGARGGDQNPGYGGNQQWTSMGGWWMWVH